MRCGGGVPAKLISKRFDDETIRQLEKISWWDHVEKMKKCVTKETDVTAFLEEWKRNEDSALG